MFLQFFAKVAKCYLVGTRVQLMKITIKWRLQSDVVVSTTWQIHGNWPFLKNNRKCKYVGLSAPGARNGAQQQEMKSGRHIVYQDQMRFVSKTSDITSTGCKRTDTIRSLIIFIEEEQDSTTISADYGDVPFSSDVRLQKRRDTPRNIWRKAVRNYLRLLSYPALLL